jgi:hypothetical protein
MYLIFDRDSPNGHEILNKPFGSARVISLPVSILKIKIDQIPNHELTIAVVQDQIFMVFLFLICFWQTTGPEDFGPQCWYLPL